MKGGEGQWDRQKLTCCEITQQTSEYLDDRLSPPTQVRMTLHLASCRHCRTYVKQVGFVQQALSFLPMQNLEPINQDVLRRRFQAWHTQ